MNKSFGRTIPGNHTRSTGNATSSSTRPLPAQRITGLHWALAGLILISIGRVHDHVPGLAAFRPALLLTVIALGLALLSPGRLRIDNLFNTAPARLFGLFLLAVLLSAVFGISTGASAQFLATIFTPVAITFLILLTSIRNLSDIAFFSTAFSFAVFLVAIASIFLAEPYYVDGYWRQGGVGMYDPNDVGVVFMTGLPFAVVLLRSQRTFLKLLGAATCLGILVSLVLSASRGGFLGLVVCGAAILFLSPGLTWGRKLFLAIAPILLMALLAPEGYWRQMSTIVSAQEDYNITSETGRVAIWTRGLGFVQEYPVFGVGPSNFQRAAWELSDAGRTGLQGVPLFDLSPHNTFLQVWSEIGTLGLTFWIGMIGVSMILLLRLRQRLRARGMDQRHPQYGQLYLLASYLPASFIGFSATSFFVTHAYTPIFYILLACSTGTLVAGSKVLAQKNHGRFVRPDVVYPTRSPFLSINTPGPPRTQ